MNLITLVNSEHVTLASGQRVFSAEDSGALRSSVESADALSKLLLSQQSEVAAAEEIGRKEGYQNGYDAGRLEADNVLATELLNLAAKAQKDATVQQQKAVTLAMQIVRKIAADLAPEQTLLALASSAARECIDTHDVVLKVHPQRLEATKNHLHEIQDPTRRIPRFAEVVADEALELEGCVIETPLGAIVADLDTQLTALTRELSANSA